MTRQSPSGQNPLDPQGAFAPPPPPRNPSGMPMGPGGPPPFFMPPGSLPPFPAPGMFPPFGPPPPRHGFRRFVSVIIVLALLGSVFLNLLQFATGLFGGHSTSQVALENGDIKQTIAVIPITGVILQGTADRFYRQMMQVEANANVKAIVLAVDTPGGSVAPSDQMYHRIEVFRSDHPNIPVVVSMGGLATSGGYYVSAGADYIFAQPTTWTGNIGVLMPRYNFHDLAQKYGVHESTITAPVGGMKNAGSMFSEDNERDTAYLQNLINVAYARFTKVVSDGRGNKLTKPIAAIADGSVYPCDEAKKLGLVDDVGYLDDACRYAASRAGLEHPMVIKYQDTPSLLEALTGGESKSTLPGVSWNLGPGGSGVSVNVDGSLLDSVLTPRVWYLWQGK